MEPASPFLPRYAPEKPSESTSQEQSELVINQLRPSSAMMRWISRTIQSITADAPWVYEEEAPAAARSSAPHAVAQPSPSSARDGPDGIAGALHERFIRMGREFYFPSGESAFRDLGTRVLTQSENLEVVRTLIQIAQSRGWQDITVTGSDRFKRDAWREGTYMGLVVRGYRPTEFDKAQFVRDVAVSRGGGTAQSTGSNVQTAPARDDETPADLPKPSRKRGKARTAALQEGVAHPERASGGPAEPQTPTRSGQVGRLLEHGAAPYRFTDGEDDSYFVKIETARGTKVLWGIDLQRAVGEAGVQPGDAIEFQTTGRERVTVVRRDRDESGAVIAERRVVTHRNRWEVWRPGEPERTDAPEPTRGQALRQPASKVLGAARADPAVASALVAVKGAELLADAVIANPAERGAFVDAVRERIEQSLDRGINVPKPPLRIRTPARDHGERVRS